MTRILQIRYSIRIRYAYYILLLFESHTEGVQTPSSPARKSPPMVGFSVPEVGLEPTTLARHDFESCAYTIPPLRQFLKRSLETVSECITGIYGIST